MDKRRFKMASWKKLSSPPPIYNNKYATTYKIISSEKALKTGK